jgi:hypothetical protein
MTDIPDFVSSDEPLHRRISPEQVRDDGSPSSQAYTDPEMSVDRGHFRDPVDSLSGYDGFGLAGLIAQFALDQGLQVLSDKLLLNPAHAVVRGNKTRATARRLARASTWVVQIAPPSSPPHPHAPIVVVPEDTEHPEEAIPQSAGE